MDEVDEFNIEEGQHQAIILKFSYGKSDLHELHKQLLKVIVTLDNLNFVIS